MPIRKQPKAVLRRDYVLLIEIGMIVSLAVLILAFRIDWRSDSTLTIVQLDQELVPKAVLQARFTPGKQRGKAVRVKMSLPITFKLT